MAQNPRAAAVDALYDIEKNGEYSTRSINEKLKDLESKDKALANELILGVLRNKLYLDFIIQNYSKIRLKKLNPYVLQILRTGVHQLTSMDRVPAFAICNEAVKLSSKKAHSAKGFVNGVLRSISRELDSLPKPKGSEAERMSVEYSCPVWLTEKLVEQFGIEKCNEILKDSLVPHPTTIRANSLKIKGSELAEKLYAEGVSAEPDEEIENCLKVNGAININASDLYKGGYYTLQNINSQRTAIILEPKSGETVLDLCAAPGGKTTHIAELMGDSGRVVAFDIHEHKVNLIEKAAKRLGIGCIEARCGNSENFCEEFSESADRVLADVPCSGIGVIHRKPDIKFNRKPDDIPVLCEMQRKILDTASRYVKRGGTLVYSTCTILKEENSDRVEEFLREHNDFEKDFEKLYLAHETGGSGFYICRMKRKK